MSGASEQANGQASGPVLQSVFLVNLAHCGEGSWVKGTGEVADKGKGENL